MNFWSFYPQGNKTFNSSIEANELKFNGLTKTQLLLNNKIEQYKSDPTKYEIHRSYSMDYMDMAYKYYGDKNLWWVILLFNDEIDLLFALSDAELIKDTVDRMMNAITYYSHSSKGGEWGGLDERHRHFAYVLPLILGKNAMNAPYIPVPDDLDKDGIKNEDYYEEGIAKEYIYALMREFYIRKMGYDLYKAIKATNDFMKHGKLYADLVDEDSENDYVFYNTLRDFLLEKTLEIYSNRIEVKIPKEHVMMEIVDLMYENSENWNKTVLSVK